MKNELIHTQTYLSSIIILIVLVVLFNTEGIVIEFFATLSVFFTGMVLGGVMTKNKNKK
jgi:hypothetical protein